jgi:protein-S-isoprenylcysteine O-methyltransferase Ste14
MIGHMTRLKKLLLAILGGLAAGAALARLDLQIDTRLPAVFDHAITTRWPWIGAALGWVIFSLYWEIAARNAAPAKSAESRSSRAIHLLLANAAIVLEMVPLRGLGRYLPLSSTIMAGGLAVEAVGLSLAILARRHLGRNWSGEISIKLDHQLIRSGPYKKLRHPIYTGLLTMYAGTALVTGTWLALAGFALAAFAYVRKIRLEEANLNVAFGPEYAAYRRETWALVPGLF